MNESVCINTMSQPPKKRSKPGQVSLHDADVFAEWVKTLERRDAHAASQNIELPKQWIHEIRSDPALLWTRTDEGDPFCFYDNDDHNNFNSIDVFLTQHKRIPITYRQLCDRMNGYRFSLVELTTETRCGQNYSIFWFEQDEIYAILIAGDHGVGKEIITTEEGEQHEAAAKLYTIYAYFFVK